MDSIDHGKPPEKGWAPLVCELHVENIEASSRFWLDLLGFDIAYQRPEENFLYLERPEGAQIMLCQRSGKWETAELRQPFGRGAMFQIYVGAIDDVLTRLNKAHWPLYAGPHEVWRRWGDREGGKREILVQDPDGYLIMLAEDLGERPISAGDQGHFPKM